jgi:hypothetical protein
MPQLTTEIVSAAIDGLEEKRRRLDEQIAELRTMLPGGRTSYTPANTTEGPGKRKKFSAAARRKMAMAQKARWARIKGEPGTSVAATSKRTSKPKRKMSAEGRQAIAEATKKRWAAFHAAKEEKAAAKATRKTAAKATGKRTVKKSAAKKTAAAPATEQAAG